MAEAFVGSRQLPRMIDKVSDTYLVGSPPIGRLRIYSDRGRKSEKEKKKKILGGWDVDICYLAGCTYAWTVTFIYIPILG